MPNNVIPEDPGLLASIGDAVGDPGYVIRNLAKGNFEGAGRKFVDFLGDIIDAPIPGDWIPHISRPEDNPEFSDLIGGMDEGWGKTATNLIGNTLTDPLTFVPGAAVLKGLGVASKGIGGAVKLADKVIPGTAANAQAALVNTKSALGWLKPNTAGVQEALDEQNAVKAGVNKTATVGARKVFQGVNDRIAKLTDQVVGNYTQHTPSGFNSMMGPMYEKLKPGSETLSQNHQIAEEIAARTPVDTSGLAQLDTALPDLLESPRQFQQFDPLSMQLGIKGVAPTAEGMIRDPALGASEGAFRTAEHYPQKTLGPIERTKVDDLSKALGVNGVADPGPLSMGVPGNMQGGMSFVHQMADNAADVTREAFPRTLSQPLVDLSGHQVGSNKIPLNMAAEPVERIPREKPLFERDPYTGAGIEIPPVIPKDEGILFPKSVAEYQAGKLGGRAAELERVPAESLGRQTKNVLKPDEQLAQWNSRVDALEATEEEKNAVRALLPKYQEFTQNNLIEKVKDFPGLKPRMGEDPEHFIPQDYAHRVFTGGDAKSLEGRSLTEPQDFINHMNETRGSGRVYEENLAKSTLHLADQAGTDAGKAALGKSLLGDKFVALADEGSRKAMSDYIENIKVLDPEGHRLLSQAWEGQGQPGKFMQFLQGANKVFKPAAVYGIAIPHTGAIMKNILSFPAQLVGQGEYKQAGLQALKTPFTVYEAMRQGLAKSFGWQLPAGAVGKASDQIASAIQQAGGRAANATALLRSQGREDLALALEHGVADGFVGREAAEDSIRNSSWGRKIMSQIGMGEKAQTKAFDLADAPAAAFQGAETHARLGTFLDMLERNKAAGMAPAEAAAKAAGITSEALYDYSVATGANRTLRTIIPFAAYQTNAIRQTAKFAVNNPWAAVAGAEALRRDKDKPIYPYMENKTNVPLGRSDTGDQQYLTGLGLPFEALNSIPNPSANPLDFGADVRNKLIGMSQPLLKTAVAYTTGQDPYFDTPVGSYTKLPGNIEAGNFGRAYNQIAGTGLLQPITGAIQQAGTAIDDRTSLAQKALQFGTGSRVVTVNEDQALRQQLQAFIKNNPDIKSYAALYTNSDNPDTKAVLAELKAIKKRIKERRAADSAHIPQTVPALL